MLNRILGLAVITLEGEGRRFEKALKIFQADSPLLQNVLETTSTIHCTFYESDPPPDYYGNYEYSSYKLCRRVTVVNILYLWSRFYKIDVYYS